MSESPLGLILDAHRARKQDPARTGWRQHRRFREMVAYAHANSPYYRELYQALPEQIDAVGSVPTTDKKRLMARFDDWVTDRDVTLDRIRAFIDDPGCIGEPFLGRYTAATTSGTTGTRGIFLMDDRSMAVTGVLALRMLGDWLRPADVVRILVGRGRMTMVIAIGGHFASAVAAARLHQRRGDALQVLPVEMPLPELVAQLNRFQPAVLAPYASVGALLATEQETGRLRIDPAMVVLSAEGLPGAEYRRIGKAFGAVVRDSYAATECPFLSYRCEHGWLHVNSDWAMLEPVDADHRPVWPGEPSHTVLLSNLANRVQPILRYDLGDSVLQRSDPCPCGNPLPAIRVQGRAADGLTFATERGGTVTLPPLAFGMLVERIPGLELVQIVQTTRTSLRVRLLITAGADPDRTWTAVHAELTRVLAAQGLGHVTVERDQHPPERLTGGKIREIIPLRW
ncbi:phenylacetate--CoA ligase family protein [Microvirga sp. Mcv34]|uniref:phenylacetate--CoA ligase family protein n=1 Tax=Microvirga sp. Mcv34 TaxID=2926016 RepID=UPI0021C5A2A5|nr:phenylacetate--CoA ligase family protein [Microvirga sp. Mcv34]